MELTRDLEGCSGSCQSCEFKQITLFDSSVNWSSKLVISEVPFSPYILQAHESSRQQFALLFSKCPAGQAYNKASKGRARPGSW